ncbi:MAG TPA: hypothetical protein VLS92_01735 [Acidimicrobiia bacterium]|nr:hypothetical protein [Acidimicrobiia bacterium]
MEFVATPEFRDAYGRLDQRAAERVDEAIWRLAGDPSSAWARQNRVLGERGAAWLIIVRHPTGDCALYWDQPDPAGPVQLLLLLDR